MTELLWRLQRWPEDSPEETWEDVGEPVEAPDWESAVREIAPPEPGRYRVVNDDSLDHGQLFRFEADGTITPAQGF